MKAKAQPKPKPKSKTTASTVPGYDTTIPKELAAICRALRREIQLALPQASSKIWHGAPVWFLDANPIVGYSLKAKRISLLFWGGQLFAADGLKKVGSFKAAEATYGDAREIRPAELRRWLKESRTKIWVLK